MGPTKATSGPATFAREPCFLSWRVSHVPPPLIIESVGFMWRAQRQPSPLPFLFCPRRQAGLRGRRRRLTSLPPPLQDHYFSRLSSWRLRTACCSSGVLHKFQEKQPVFVFLLFALVRLPDASRDTRGWARLHQLLSVSARASKAVELVLGDGKDEEDARRWNSATTKSDDSDEDGPSLMSEDERKEMRRKIREVLDTNLNVEEETDPVQRRIKMQKLLEDYSLVVEEEDPNWPEDADGRGFNLDQFFNKITIKNVRNDDGDDNYDNDKEVVWQDDNYIRSVRDITAREWEDTVFKDFNPLVILVHNRYRRLALFFLGFQFRYFSVMCVAIDACVEHDLVDALQVSIYPEVLFTKAGKILHRDKVFFVSVVRSADEWSKIMAFFYYKAVRPSCLEKTAGKDQEKIPSLS
ncbi:hypothetical protein B296_00058460 [Ensete ventricosum]|uniref:Uncharacterized protein n=1 Tax=Ensete ventricosum TaxID=4639 RepID=A0A426XM22_ENSVE|nr:hypothetical protein B296_00058460 [Ensete ventricosum]